MVATSERVGARSLAEIRSSADRWRQLRTCLRRLEQMAQAAAVIDAVGLSGVKDKFQEAVEFEDHLGAITRVLNDAESRLTVEVLQAELKAMKKASA